MSQTADTEPPRWPIAPDGYIPNSVIRSWKRKGKGFAKMDSCNDNFSALLYMDEASDEDEDMNSRIFWLTDDDEEEEKEETEKEDEKKNKKQKVEKTEVGVKAREDEKKEKKQDKMDRSVSRPIAIHENEHQPLRELREDVKLPETITPLQKYVSVTNKQTPFTSLIKKDDKMDRSVLAKQSYNSSGPPVERSAVSADTVIPKQELRASLYIPPTEPTNLTSHPLMAPPPSQEKPQPQPITDKRHSFITSNPCGKTLYGRLQFDWIREPEGDKLLLVSGVKIKHTAHKVSVKTGL
ncbi:hypothetical protein D5F01_LYC06589 [Larimichthys crocea]|uniref:Uncharacterized protein n=1 Tax=Larimichthys crocea TaxID=215358 RepID=A0A6G0IWF1_LARCR|nr:hypothetical protein D5F01_LYC06589 [Larimichthys crocea]